MRIIEGIKMRGTPFDIPDCGRNDLPQFFVEMGYKVGAEVGVQKGIFSEELCKAGLKLYAIDPWKNYADYWGGESFQDVLDKQLARCRAVLAPYDCTIIRKTSMEALADFEDGSLDFVYIDANHEFKYVTEDIFEWSKKVRVGGVIAGHDYFYAQERQFDSIHVRYVVDAYTKAFGINPWFVIGRKEKVAGEVRDNFRSFMWIKK
jgi:hypothetical protein